MDEFRANELLHFQVSRSVTNLYKGFLVILEDLQHQHDIHFEKLRDALPDHEDLITQADYFDEQSMDYTRKKVLDIGNDCRRQIETELHKFEIEF